jgi:hypothetical protein
MTFFQRPDVADQVIYANRKSVLIEPPDSDAFFGSFHKEANAHI